MKNIQIPYDLFVSLLRYHLLEINDCEAEIQKGLEKKLDALVMHDLYSRSKAAPTAEEREKARQEYLDKRGVFPLMRDNRSVARSCRMRTKKEDRFDD